MDANELHLAALRRSFKTGERYGQALFNLLYELDPDTANRIRGTIDDPFYAESSHDVKVKLFFAAIS